MPNWTLNTIVITSSSKEALDKFYAKGKPIEKGCHNFTFASWRPMPKTFREFDTTNHPNGDGLVIGKFETFLENSRVVTEELIQKYKEATKYQKKKYGVVGWYSWRCKNYGCKWDCEPFYLERMDDYTARFSADTPWSAPEAFLLYISSKYPEFEIECRSHYEDGYNVIHTYIGGCQYDNTELVDEYKSKLYDFIKSKLEEESDNLELDLKCLDQYINNDHWYITMDNDDNYDAFCGNLDWLRDDCA